MRKTLWAISFLFAFGVSVLAVGYLGVTRSIAAILAPSPTRGAAVVPQPAPSHDDAKPTVAIVLGNTPTESTDFLGPYALFAESGRYNVYAVASTRAARALSGGLDVIPQLSFAELEARVPGGVDVVVVPAIAFIESPENHMVLEWLRTQGKQKTVLFSWCEGAAVLAASGVIDGRNVTTHWASIGRYERTYPRVNWKQGLRYIDDGTLITTAGLTSGIDATLRFLETRQEPAIAEKVRLALNLPASPYIADPRMPQHSTEASDSTLILNLGFGWWKPRVGIPLRDGVDELAVTAALDVYQATDHLYTFADEPFVTSKHGLQLVPRWNTKDLPKLERTVLPAAGNFAFKTALEDLAREHNVASAVFAAKRLEVRSELALTGAAWPFREAFAFVLSGFSGVAVLVALRRLRFVRGKSFVSSVSSPAVGLPSSKRGAA